MAPTGDRATGWTAALFSRQLLVSVAAAAATGAAVYVYRGDGVFWQALRDDGWLILFIVPIASGSILLSACLRVLVPEALVQRWLGERSGLTGLLIAATIGMLVPGGPITSFPLVAALIAAGADIGVTIAFLTSWSMLGLSRVIVWELPLLGWRFAAIRFAASLLLPIAAGLVARRLPHRFVLPQRESL